MDYILTIDNVDEVADIMESMDFIDREGAIYLTNGGEITVSLGDGLWEIKKVKIDCIIYIVTRIECLFFMYVTSKKVRQKKWILILGKKE